MASQQLGRRPSAGSDARSHGTGCHCSTALRSRVCDRVVRAWV